MTKKIGLIPFMFVYWRAAVPCLKLAFFSRPYFFIKRKRITATQLRENPRSAELYSTTEPVARDLAKTIKQENGERTRSASRNH
jgi:hypothetical protein